MVVIITSQMQIIVDSRRQLLLENQNCLKLSLVLFTHTQRKKKNTSMYISKLGKTFIVKTQQNERSIKASEIDTKHLETLKSDFYDSFVVFRCLE